MVDILITDAHVVTVNHNFDYFEQGAIAITGGEIIEVGESSQLIARYEGKRVIAAHDMLIMPGLINSHTHAAMTLLRGISDDVSLETWLKDYIWPAEKAVMTPEAVYTGTQLALVEMIRSGTTTLNDTYFFADQVATAVDQAGLRAMVAEPVADFPMPGAKDEASYYVLIEALMKKWGNHPRIHIALGPHATYTCSPDLLRRIGDFSRKHQLPVHIHLSETPTEVATIRERYQTTPMRHMQSLGLLTKGLIAAHAVVLDAEEITLLAQAGVGVAHNPQSNMKLGSGCAPVPELLRAGVPVGLGTDGPASNNNLDMLEEMGTAALLQKLTHGDPAAIRARQVVQMATMGSAQVLGLHKTIGSLEKGKRADLILINLNAAHIQPFYDPYSTLVYVATGADVDSVMVEGRFLMRQRQLLTLNEGDIIKRARVLGENIRKVLREPSNK